MTDLVGRVTAVLGRSVAPSVIARGGTIRAADVNDGVATLEVTGSPGAVLPVVARIETLIHAAVPEVIAVRITVATPTSEPDSAQSLLERARRIVDTEINPAIAAHHGHAVVDDAVGGWVRLRLEGGCQGCSLAEVTLRQGIEPLLHERLPDIIGLADVTDHRAGVDPYFSPKKR